MWVLKITLHNFSHWKQIKQSRNRSLHLRTKEIWVLSSVLSEGESLFVQRSGSDGCLNESRHRTLLPGPADDAGRGRGAAA